MREVHGVANKGDIVAVRLTEDPPFVRITIGLSWSEIAPGEARYLARCLNRMARRIENGEVES